MEYKKKAGKGKTRREGERERERVLDKISRGTVQIHKIQSKNVA